MLLHLLIVFIVKEIGDKRSKHRRLNEGESHRICYVNDIYASMAQYELSSIET